jgi:transposase InsO family protein
VIHDRHSTFSTEVDAALSSFGVHVLKTPVRTPTANAYCERLIGTLRRECLDYFIPLNERHLRIIFKEFVSFYNRGRPHSSLGPGIPERVEACVPAQVNKHHLPAGYRIAKTAVLGGLHHEYRLEKVAA